jgi:hypothetical protein
MLKPDKDFNFTFTVYDKDCNKQQYKGFFNLYQSCTGAIYLQMGNQCTELSKKQIDDLAFCCYELADFDVDRFNQYYKC